jgi:hypothetical protein
MKGLIRINADINWTIQGPSTGNPRRRAVGFYIVKAIPSTHCVDNDVFDWNLIMMSCDQEIPNQCYAIQLL